MKIIFKCSDTGRVYDYPPGGGEFVVDSEGCVHIVCGHDLWIEESETGAEIVAELEAL